MQKTWKTVEVNWELVEASGSRWEAGERQGRNWKGCGRSRRGPEGRRNSAEEAGRHGK